MAIGYSVSSQRCLARADAAISLFVIFPSTVMYWRGIWDLYGVYVLPEDECRRSNWAVFGIGCMAYFGYFLHPGIGAILRRFVGDETDSTLLENVDNNSQKPTTIVESDCRRWIQLVVYVLITRLYLYFYAATSMAYWRGVWLLADYYLRDVDALTGSVAGLVVCYGILVALRCTKSLMFPPFVVAHDSRPDLLETSPRYRTQVKWTSVGSFTIYAINSFFTFSVINTVVIVTWRSTFALFDVILQYEEPVIADATWVVCGLVACTCVFVGEPLFAELSARCKPSFWRSLAFEQLITALQYVSSLLLWRGAWNLNTQFVISDPLVGGWVNHVCGTVLLMVLQQFSIVGSCGCSVDHVNPCSDHFATVDHVPEVKSMFNTRYLRHFFLQSDNDRKMVDEKEKDMETIIIVHSTRV